MLCDSPNIQRHFALVCSRTACLYFCIWKSKLLIKSTQVDRPINFWPKNYLLPFHKNCNFDCVRQYCENIFKNLGEISEKKGYKSPNLRDPSPLQLVIANKFSLIQSISSTPFQDCMTSSC